jgi:hypothetical protein
MSVRNNYLRRIGTKDQFIFSLTKFKKIRKNGNSIGKILT